MSLILEIEAAFNKAQTVPLNLADPDCKSLCDQLTALCWKVIQATSLEGDLSEECFTAALAYTTSFPHLNSRLYEIMWLYRLNREYLKGNFDAREFKKSLIADIKSDHRPTRSNLLLQGICEYYLNGINEAQYYFLRANQEYISRGMITPFFSYSRSICPIVNLDQGVDRARPRAIGNKPPSDCILIAGNSSYITRFLDNYAKSIATHCPEITLHLHWIKDGNIEVDEAGSQAISEVHQILGDSFKVSSEMCPDIGDKRSYYALSRFLVARDILQSYRRLIITDIDYEAIGSLDDFLSYCDQYEVCLQTSSTVNSLFPWLKVLAGTVVVKSNSVGRLFLETYRRCYELTYLPYGLNWGIDQNILSSIHDKLFHFGFIGNSRLVKNPFTVPYHIKRSSV
ncbi:hypothetical protein [Burkholderia sp. A9]|uniref:hypothetical protein n=1 Tax=Burkholderia sp. A9 TaxID=1365108 RepID=UPI00126A3BB2|nr:hypothetical protein [Burkholderia sp. A9]